MHPRSRLIKEKVPEKAKTAIENAINKSSEELSTVEKQRGRSITGQVEKIAERQPLKIEDVHVSRIESTSGVPFVATLPE